MKLEIVYKLGKMHFKATADSISEAYEYIKAIVNSGVYIRPSDELDKFMYWLSQIYLNHVGEREDDLIKIRALKEESVNEKVES